MTAIVGNKTGTVSEDSTAAIAGKIETDDASAKDAFVVQAETPGSYGLFSLATNGQWQYRLSNELDAVQALRQDESVFDTFFVSYNNQLFATVRIQVLGKNDAPQIVGQLSLSVIASAGKTMATVKVNDPDRDESLFVPVTGQAGQLGKLSITNGGAIEYVLNSPAPVLQVSQVEAFTVSTVDGTTTTIKVTVDPVTAVNAITGTEGNDLLQASSGSDSVVGGAGIDTVQLGGPRTSFIVTRDAGNASWRIGGEGQDTLKDVERLKFTDVSIALDIDGNAGKVAKVLGAVFGKSAVQNKGYVGIGLGLMDGGMSYEKLVETAINAALGVNATNEQIVNLLYTNVVGTAPSAAAQAQFVAMLDSGSMTKGGLGVMAADTSLNTVNIGLVGLADTGLAYIPG